MFCQDCGMEVASTYKMCPKCGSKQFVKGRPQATEQAQPIPTFTSVQESVSHEQVEADFFAVSKVKLVVMTVFTLGLYQIYWFYKQWQSVKQQEGSDIIPAARAFFSVFFCYGLFKKVRDKAFSVGVAGKPLQAGFLAAGWIFLTIVPNQGFLPDFLFVLSFFALLFLLPVQHAITQILAIESPDMDQNNRFTGANIAAIIVGTIVLFLAIFGALAEL